jgi:hypothetical protein
VQQLNTQPLAGDVKRQLKMSVEGGS